MNEKQDYGGLWEEQIKGRLNTYDTLESARRYYSSLPILEDGEKRAKEIAGEGLYDTVLDIGSGPGILAIPLARAGLKVTAIDPSANMLSLLRERMEDEGLSCIELINARWDDVSEESLSRYDLAIASYSLFMRDIKSALLKMNRMAKKRVCLYWFSGVTAWEKICLDLYPVVHKKEYPLLPKADLIYGVLSQMGISADIKTLKNTAFDYRYESMEAALANIRQRLGLSGSEDGSGELLKKYIEENYQKDGGSYWFKDKTNYVKIEWEPKE